MATAKQLPRTHAGVATDHVDLANDFETLGATLRVQPYAMRHSMV